MLDKNYKIVEANLIEKLMASEKKVRHLQASIDSVIQECQYFRSEIMDENNLPMIYNKKQIDNYANKLQIIETMLEKI